MWAWIPKEIREQVIVHAGSETLVGRVAGPEDLAKACLSLIDQDYVTGTVSLIDGGALLT